MRADWDGQSRSRHCEPVRKSVGHGALSAPVPQSRRRPCAGQRIWLYYSQIEVLDRTRPGGSGGPPITAGNAQGGGAAGAREASAACAGEVEQEPHQTLARTVQAAVPAPRRRNSSVLRRHGRYGGSARNHRKVGGRDMARPVRKSRGEKVPLSEVKDDLSRYLREAEDREAGITRHGKPAGVLIGFKSEDDWFDYRLENDPRFLRRIANARDSLGAGRGVKLEDVDK